jgi:hypothetical protein
MIKESDQLPTIQLMHHLFGLLQLKGICMEFENADLFEITFDVTAGLLDEWPKAKQTELGQWIQANVFYRDDNSRSSKMINSLLPFPKLNILLDGITGGPEQDLEPKPWDWIEVGSQPSRNATSGSSIDSNNLNNSCISLEKFAARRCRDGFGTFESLYHYGWKKQSNRETVTNNIKTEAHSRKRSLEDEEQSVSGPIQKKINIS